MRKTTLLTSVKSITVAIMLAGLLALSQSAARADELTIVATTTGDFGSSSTLNNLTYNPALINRATTNGILPLTATPSTPNINNLGSFTLVGIPGDFNQGFFDLRVQFAAPGGITFGNPREIVGSAFLFGTGTEFGLLIDMDNAPQLFTFSDATGTGVFSLAVDDVFFNLGNVSSTSLAIEAVPIFVLPLTGMIRVTSFQPVPEPATLLLMVTGMAAVAATVHRRIR